MAGKPAALEASLLERLGLEASVLLGLLLIYGWLALLPASILLSGRQLLILWLARLAAWDGLDVAAQAGLAGLAWLAWLACSHQLRKYIGPIQSTYFDWMHSTVASGSMGQYEVNSFCSVLVAEGVTTLAGIDEFSQSIKWPPSRGRLPKNFFQKRVTETLDGHISAFAG